MINARAETLAEKSSLKNAFRAHRCIIPATDKLQKLLAPYPASEMASYKVSKSVNIPDNYSPELIEEIK